MLIICDRLIPENIQNYKTLISEGITVLGFSQT